MVRNFFFFPSFGCDGNCRLRSSWSPAPPFDSKISFNQKMRRLDVQKHFALALFFSPLRTAILAVANKHAALSPRHGSLRQPCLQIPGHPAAAQHPRFREKGILAPGQKRKSGLSWFCGAGSGVAGRCGAGTELIAAVSPPASSRFISSPLGCRPGERRG